MATRSSQDAAPTYELCLSFTRDGLTRRVPWVFVLYATGAKKGTRMRAKDTSELANLTTAHPINHTYRFLAREEAYVDNYRCHGRVVLRRNLTLTDRNEAQATIEATELSAIIDGKRDCQKWCVECIEALGFPAEMVRFWEGLLGANVWEIEEGVNGLEGKWGLGFLRSLSYRLREVAEKVVTADKERIANEMI